jgi:hypothetical protein
VALVLPHHLDEPRAGTQRVGNVGECGAGVTEEHRAEPANAEGETLRRKGMHLGITLLEMDVVQPLLLAELTGGRHHLGGDVDAHRASEDRGFAGFPRGESGATADVEHVVIGSDIDGRTESLVVTAQLGVIVERPAVLECGHGRTLWSGTS